jgi:flavin-dependent dehydrogenase
MLVFVFNLAGFKTIGSDPMTNSENSLTADIAIQHSTGNLSLDSGSRVAVIGGGPAGSLFSYYLLDMAGRMGMDIKVDIYEPRDFSQPAPRGCNMCGGIISESLVQLLAADGINLPTTVVQRGIDSYMLHMDVGNVRIETPLHEKRIAAVTRGSGPRDIKEIKWQSFDGHLQKLAVEKGANVIQDRVTAVEFRDGRPSLKTRKGDFRVYDLLTVATGVNSAATRLFQNLNIGYKPPETTKTFICEYYLGADTIDRVLGSSMHVFLLNIPRLEFAAIIPKGDYATVCMLGEDIDNELIQAFINSAEVKNCMPEDWTADMRSCNCLPRINVEGATQPYSDRIVFIGDSGVTRLYKDGIGAAYRTAKAAASTAIFQGVSVQDFEEYFMPICRGIARDNSIGKINFMVTKVIQQLRFTRRALLRMTSMEQQQEGSERRMSMVLWDMFTGSAPYLDIFKRTLHPKFLGLFVGYILLSFFGIDKRLPPISKQA